MGKNRSKATSKTRKDYDYRPGTRVMGSSDERPVLVRGSCSPSCRLPSRTAHSFRVSGPHPSPQRRQFLVVLTSSAHNVAVRRHVTTDRCSRRGSRTESERRIADWPVAPISSRAVDAEITAAYSAFKFCNFLQSPVGMGRKEITVAEKADVAISTRNALPEQRRFSQGFLL